uniref:Uncharacterized protein n=1 Tax=Plectus sambesii TaxID=2011161 RepID=A0A914VEJ5_9BILA
TNDAPPAEEQECLALRQCWETVPQVYRWPFIIAIVFLFLLIIGFLITFFITSSGGHFDY